MICIYNIIKLGLFLTLLILSPFLWSGPVENSFKVYHSLGYIGLPDLHRKYGIEYLKIYGHAHFWDKDVSPGPIPTKKKMNDILSDVHKYKRELVCLDIETWLLKIKSGTNNSSSIEKYKFVASELKRLAPDLSFGYYGVLPIREYYAPVKANGEKTEAMDRWRRANAELEEINDHVDVIMPSLYTFKNDSKKWKVYAIANLKEARKYNKPVIAFLWPEFHKNIFGDDFVDGKYWKLQLETVQQYADGVVIWGPKLTDKKWNEKWDWWFETKRFMEKLKNS